MAKKFTRIMAMLLVLATLFSVISVGAFAAENSAENTFPINKTANGLDENDQTDVTLTVPGTVEGNIDVVFILGGGMALNIQTITSAIEVFRPVMENGKATVRMGLISLEKGKEIILDLNSDEAVLDPDTYVDFVTAKFDSINDLPSGSTNLHSQLLEAQKMLAKETKAKAENKYVFVLATGRTYWFDDANGEQAMVVNKVTGNDKKTHYYWGNYLWQSQRGGHSSLYMIPDRYNNSYEAFYKDIEKWVTADGDKYVFTPHFDVNDYSAYKTWEQKNNKDLRTLGVAGSRYGNGIENPVPTAENFVNGEMNAIGSGSNPQNALNYERAQYECIQVWKELVAANYNCYSICSETAYYQNNSPYIANRSYKGTSTTMVGHSFMNYLATLAGQKEAPAVWEFKYDENGNNTWEEVLDENFFDSVRDDMLYTTSIGSTVVDYIGKNENGNFEFIEKADCIKLNVGGVDYITTQVASKDGANSSYTFTAPGATEPTFWLDYYYGDGKTTECFVWTFGENVSLERLASLTYKLQLTEKKEEEGTYIVPTNNSATLYPKDSDGNDRDPQVFPVPEVEYEVKKEAVDIVIAIGPGIAGTANGVEAVLKMIRPVMQHGYQVNFGLVGVESLEHEVLPLTELGDDFETFIRKEMMNMLNLSYGPTDLESPILAATRMLDNSDTKTENKYMFVLATGRTYWWDENGVPATIVTSHNYKGTDYTCWGHRAWQRTRINHTSLYAIPGIYNDSYDAYFADIAKWVQADGNTYAYYVDFGDTGSAYANWQSKNGDYNVTGKYAPAIIDNLGLDAGFIMGEDGQTIPSTYIRDPGVQHALNYERAQYEALAAYRNAQNKNYNVYAISTESLNYQSGSSYIADNSAWHSYGWNTVNQVGDSFMDYLAGGRATNAINLAGKLTNDFFPSIINHDTGDLIRYQNPGQIVLATDFGSATENEGENDGPIKFTKLADVEGALGETVSVTVEAEGEGLKYQWYFKNANAKEFSKSSTRVATYEVEMDKTRAGREIYCVITDKDGNTVTTNTVKLVRVVADKLEIMTQPTDAEAAIGETISVSVEAKGEDLKYQWYFKNANGSNFSASSIKTAVYETEMNASRANREVYCVITDALGNKVTTDTVKLIRVAKEELKILNQPEKEDIYTRADNMISVTIEAQGEGLKYQWYFKNANGSSFSASSIKTATYETEMNKTRANREIYCVITDALGNKVESNHFFLRPGTEPVQSTEPVTPSTEPEQPAGNEDSQDPALNNVNEDPQDSALNNVNEDSQDPALNNVNEDPQDPALTNVNEDPQDPALTNVNGDSGETA